MDTQYDAFYFTKGGIIVPTITASLSCLSSLAIISFILRSKSNTIYHRILFCLSVADFVASFAMALTTLPMPKSVIYPFARPSYGTIETCEAQGLAYLIGTILTLCFNAILGIYYVCTLSFNVSVVVFRRFIEPVLYISAFGMSSIPILLLFYNADMINPTIDDNFCSVREYPAGCKQKDDPNCRGDSDRNQLFIISSSVVFGMSFATVFVSMGIIMYTFITKERKIRAQLDDKSNGTGEDQAASLNKLREWEYAQRISKIVTRQASLYVGAFLITWTITICCTVESIRTITTMQVLRMIFQPLQGFFNMLIFFYHKVHTLLRDDHDRSVADALRLLFWSPADNPEFLVVTNLDAVHMDRAAALILRPCRMFKSYHDADSSNAASENFQENAMRHPSIIYTNNHQRNLFFEMFPVTTTHDEIGNGHSKKAVALATLENVSNKC